MTMSKLSIVIPAYNYAHTLERAVLSACRQLDENTEVIIVNDGSTDNTADVLLQLQQRLQQKIKVFTKTNGGLSSARNFGIKQASGDYLIFLDADDEMAENAILHIREHIKQHSNSRFIIGGHTSVSTNGKRKLHTPIALPATPIAKLKAYLIDKTLSISNGACLMHKSIFYGLTYLEHFRNSEDIPVFAHVLANFECSIIKAPLANVYKHDDSLRHNATYAENVGLQLVDEVFHPSRISTELQTLKKPFLAQRLLSLSRVCHENNRHSQCTEFFIQALKVNWRVIFKWSYSKKFMQSYLQVVLH
jgi:glycosyltransferase involved in cell wall biosynthesis